MENSGNHQDVIVPPVEGVAGGVTAYGWSESVACDPTLLKGMIDPTKVHSLELVHAWCMLRTANVGPQDMPRALEPHYVHELTEDMTTQVLDHIEDAGLKALSSYSKDLQELRVFPSYLYGAEPNVSLTEQGQSL